MSLVSDLLSSQWLYWLYWLYYWLCYTESNFVFCIANNGIDTWLATCICPTWFKASFSHWMNKSRKACGMYWTFLSRPIERPGNETCMMIVSFPDQLKGVWEWDLYNERHLFLNPLGHPVLCCSCLWCLLLLVLMMMMQHANHLANDHLCICTFIVTYCQSCTIYRPSFIGFSLGQQISTMHYCHVLCIVL